MKHLPSGRRRVLKTLKPELLHDRESVDERFTTSMQAFARIDHIGLARLLAVGNGTDTPERGPFVVREYVRGRPLKLWFEARRVANLDFVCTTFSFVLAALSELHSRGLVHGNLKPSNVIVQQREGSGLQAMLVDAGWQRDALSQSGEDGRYLHALPHYTSPEVIVGEPATPKSDLFSVAAMMYELLAGAPLVESDDHIETFGTLASGQVEPLARRNPMVPEPLASAIETCLAADPDSRLASAASFARQLRHYVSPHSATPVLDALPQDEPAARDVSASLKLEQAPRRRRDAACPDQILLEPAFPRMRSSSLLQELREDVEYWPDNDRESVQEPDPDAPEERPSRRALAAGTGIGLCVLVAWLTVLI